jgi:glycolate oxidase FAD binding subunit
MNVPVPFQPSDESEIADFMRGRSSDGAPVFVRGGGSKALFGRAPGGNEAMLDMSALSGILLYEPDELVLTARAGAPLGEVAAAVAARGQRLGFEPPEFGALLGFDAASTLGGAVASGWSGPRRMKAGAVRDHVLGMRAVGGDGEVFKSGGRVVKNVTGFDLPKLLTGSHGTLAVMTEITIKTMPAPEQTRTIAVFGQKPAEAIQFLCAVLGGPYEASAAAHLPAESARRSRVAPIAEPGAPVTLLRLEGFGPSIAERSAALERISGAYESCSLDQDESDILWREIRDVAPLLDPQRIVWRVSVPPTAAAAAIAKIANAVAAEAFYDWGGGLVWLSLPFDPYGHESLVRGALPSGHATLMRAPESVRASTPIFQPSARPLAELALRVKSAFDPRGVLAPGRSQAEY